MHGSSPRRQSTDHRGLLTLGQLRTAGERTTLTHHLVFLEDKSKWLRLYWAVAAVILPCASSMALNVDVAINGNINRAIQQVNAAGGGTVTLAAGNWTVNSSINMLSNVTLVGAGESSTDLNATGGFNVIQETADGESNMAVENLSIVGVSTNTSSNRSARNPPSDNLSNYILFMS